MKFDKSANAPDSGTLFYGDCYDILTRSGLDGQPYIKFRWFGVM